MQLKPPAGLSIAGIVIGIAIGIGLGLLYTWVINPVVQTNIAPWQLNKEGRTSWIIAASVAWARDNDIVLAANRLNDLRLNDLTFQRVADAACELARSSYAQNDTGLIAIRSMVNLAQGQGRAACASELVMLNTNTPAPTATLLRPTATLIPPASKTPTPLPGPTYTPATQVVETATPVVKGTFAVVRNEPYCSAKSSGVIEVFVQESGGAGIPGIAVQVDWAGGRDRFYTGLKPERDNGYADFKMREDESYTVSLPGNGERSDPLKALACTDRESGSGAITSYRLYFRRVAR